MICTGRHDPVSAQSKDDALRKPLAINLWLFLLFSLLILTVSGCRSSEVFSYGEIVYRIDYSRPDGNRITEENLARTLQIAEPLAPMFYEPVYLGWGIPIAESEPYEDYVKRVAREEAADPSLEFILRGKRAEREFRLNKDFEAEGQFIARDGFDADYSDHCSLPRVDLSVYPDDGCMFVSYKWFEYKGLMRPDEEEIKKCNEEIVRTLEDGGFFREQSILFESG